MRRNPNSALFANGDPDWITKGWKVRSYLTQELAEKNLLIANRKWNRFSHKKDEPNWIFEIRVKT